MKEIINASKLIKDDHVKVFKYWERFIIKKIPYFKQTEDYLIIEKNFLLDAKQNGVDVHVIDKITLEDDYIYVFYNYVKSEWVIDFLKVGQNFKKIHNMNNKYNFPSFYGNYEFPQYRDVDKEYDKSRILVQELFWEEILDKWDTIKEDIVTNYSHEVKKLKLNTVVHWDFNVWNIIAPNTIIDTEQMLIWTPEMDISSFYRLWYRFWNKEAMNKLLKWYWYDGDINYIKPFLFYKDLVSTTWTIMNNKWDKGRISEIKNRINNWYDLDNQWILY